MRNPEAAIEPAFYDHEHELIRERERRVDDWGVDEVFAAHPRRRFARRGLVGTDFARPARRGHDRDVPVRPSGPPAPASEPLSSVLTEGLTWTDAAFAEPAAPAGAGIDAAAPAHDVTGGRDVDAVGRRTVAITGRPDAAVSGFEHAVPAIRPPATDRRRPPKSAHERLGSRPDRVAGWAFGLGMLLIAVAVSTAEAAPL